MKKQTIMGKHSKRISCGARALDACARRRTGNITHLHAGQGWHSDNIFATGSEEHRCSLRFFASKKIGVAVFQQGQNNLPEQRRGAWGSADRLSFRALLAELQLCHDLAAECFGTDPCFRDPLESGDSEPLRIKNAAPDLFWMTAVTAHHFLIEVECS